MQPLECVLAFLYVGKQHDSGYQTIGASFAIAMHMEEQYGSQALVAHTCNPSYSGSRDQELGLKSA
jgi:hypothetical protein